MTEELYTVTDRLYEAEVYQMLDDLDAHGAALAEGPARAIAANIKLIKTCMQALPDLLGRCASCTQYLCFIIKIVNVIKTSKLKQVLPDRQNEFCMPLK